MSEKITYEKEIAIAQDSASIIVEVVDTCRVRLTISFAGTQLAQIYMDSDEAEQLRYAITNAYEDVDYWNS